MPKTKTKSAKESDSSYFLKLVIYLVLGSLWLRLTNAQLTTQVPVPLGLVIGILLTRHERFQIDRKIEFAMLLVAAFVGFWLPLGLQIVL